MKKLSRQISNCLKLVWKCIRLRARLIKKESNKCTYLIILNSFLILAITILGPVRIDFLGDVELYLLVI